MALHWNILLLACSFIIIFKGAAWFVDAAAEIARWFRIPGVIVGATIVSFATVAPELFVSVIATMMGKTELALANAVGSPVNNIGLVFALCVCFTFIPISGRVLRDEGLFMLGAVFILMALAWFRRTIDLPAALVFLALSAFYFRQMTRKAKKALESGRASRAREKDIAPRTSFNLRKQVMLFISGSLMVVGGSRLMVTAGAGLAENFGVSQSLVGLTVVAFGTSLPEFFTSFTALSRGHREISVGNILGANILDIVLVLGICGLVRPLPIDWTTRVLAIPALFLLSVLFIAFGSTRKGFQRWEGVIILGVFLVYTAVLLKTSLG